MEFLARIGDMLSSLFSSSETERLRREQEEREIIARQKFDEQFQIQRLVARQRWIERQTYLDAQPRIYPKLNSTHISSRKTTEIKILNAFQPANGRSGVWRHLVDRNKTYGTVNTNFLVNCNQDDYSLIKKLFNSTTQRHFNILNIKQIANYHLEALYALRKKEYSILYGGAKEKYLFHGTKHANILQITKNNFDWRLCGKSRGHIFGQGVSFTPISNYASNYCDTNITPRRMICAKVLMCNSCIGNNLMIVPPLIFGLGIHYDTSQKQDGHVCVKFRDDEFYPSFLIEFSGVSIKKIKAP